MRRAPTCQPLHRLALLLAVGVSAGAALAQPAPPVAGIYTCIDDKGRRLTADRPIVECAAKEQHILNRDGSLRKVIPPTLTAEERAEKEARERAEKEAKAAAADAVRRDRNLMARFPNEAAHQRARENALDTVRLAMKATELRLRGLAAERKPLLDEAEFYQGKPLPPRLKSQIDANDAAVDAQRAATATQQAELERINRLYDAELDRLRRLWSGAPAGSLGPMPAAPAAPPAPKPASR
ncbi:hypothetical protein [Rubrivivax rivuli]|uniref:DUF4124 domain-containing protein n=1 Tax=Rubrivivax rivuli TaxID=1862385 RepID=A0A437RQV3_9BURK|nr:hypothetical protein [Rubrivivax rivuli]RVU49148.1 hypothetical protein EOE66_00745 [Rubrivivax rivuli]